jgi:tRNA-dihydrouridine synthase B
MTHPFEQLGLPRFPLLLAPLAGVSDEPFRRICAREGAHLTYVEMLSATALIYESQRTYAMMRSHPGENLGVQITGRSAEEVGRAVAMINDWPFKTVDINMGCPVRKVVGAGCGSAILRDPERVFQTVKAAVAATDKPVSAKIRLGWDRNSMNCVEVAQAIESAGAVWVTVHGRTRADDYSVAVDLEGIAAVKRAVRIPVIGNGNIFSLGDAACMVRSTGVDGIMISRGALGNPWIFSELAELASVQEGRDFQLTPSQWFDGVFQHVTWHREHYGATSAAAVILRKHLLWYAKGWPGSRKLRELVNQLSCLDDGLQILSDASKQWEAEGIASRAANVTVEGEASGRFQWDPKWEMDRVLDRGAPQELPEINAEIASNAVTTTSAY